MQFKIYIPNFTVTTDRPVPRVFSMRALKYLGIKLDTHNLHSRAFFFRPVTLGFVTATSKSMHEQTFD